MSKLNDLEQKGKRKKNQDYSKEKKSESVQLRSKRQAFNTSVLYSKLRIGKITLGFLGLFIIISVLFSIRYFRYWFGIDNQLYLTRSGNPSDADNIYNYIFFLPFIITCFFTVLYLMLNIIGKTRIPYLIKKENDWTNSLPFKIENYDQALGNSDEDDFTLLITYKSAMPNEASIKNIFEGSIRYITGFNRDSQKNQDKLGFHFGQIGKKSGYRFYKKFHKLVNTVFIPTHQENPIEKIEVIRPSN
jgi:hypothetical protein